MLMCDVGNSSFDFYDNISKERFKLKSLNEVYEHIKNDVYYINVNSRVKDSLNNLNNWYDCEIYFESYFNDFKDLGVDRKSVVLGSSFNAIIIDFGTAITIDLIKNEEYLGGYIYPGIFAMQNCFKTISDRLDYSFNFNVNLKLFPKNTEDSISYGFIEPLYRSIINLSDKFRLPLVLTGGGSSNFKTLFKDSLVDELLVFKGIERVIKYNENNKK